MNTKNSICKVCGGCDTHIIYTGSIRVGKFGEASKKSYSLMKCIGCSSSWLQETLEDPRSYYVGDSYRKDFDDGTEIQDYLRLHDPEQIRNLRVTGTARFRGKVVADVGCGGGSFLDSIQGYIQKGIAIEPSATFRKSLVTRGYAAYPYVHDALKDCIAAADIAVCFSVIEHITDPIEFLNQINQLLKPDGVLYLSTPNADDILLELIPEIYAPFFYRKAHIWYFNAEALNNLLKRTGFSDIEIIPFHRFGLGNFITWVRDKRPMGDKHFDCISKTIDSVWKSELERTFKCDYLYAIAAKNKRKSNKVRVSGQRCLITSTP